MNTLFKQLHLFHENLTKKTGDPNQLFSLLVNQDGNHYSRSIQGDSFEFLTNFLDQLDQEIQDTLPLVEQDEFSTLFTVKSEDVYIPACNHQFTADDESRNIGIPISVVDFQRGLDKAFEKCELIS